MFISRFSFLVIFRVLLVLSLFPPQHLLCYCASPSSLSCQVRCVKFCLSLSNSQSCPCFFLFPSHVSVSLSLHLLPVFQWGQIISKNEYDLLLNKSELRRCWWRWMNGAWVMRGGDGDELDCTTASAKEKNRCTVRFKVCAMNADWPGKGWRRWLD